MTFPFSAESGITMLVSTQVSFSAPISLGLVLEAADGVLNLAPFSSNARDSR
jgi:hypothetical protein